MQLFTLLHEARGVLLDFGGAGGLDVAPWADRVTHINAIYDGAWELPSIGTVAAPTAVLVRPDGHAAWACDGRGDGLAEALTTWFGPA